MSGRAVPLIGYLACAVLTAGAVAGCGSSSSGGGSATSASTPATTAASPPTTESATGPLKNGPFCATLDQAAIAADLNVTSLQAEPESAQPNAPDQECDYHFNGFDQLRLTTQPGSAGASASSLAQERQRALQNNIHCAATQIAGWTAAWTCTSGVSKQYQDVNLLDTITVAGSTRSFYCGATEDDVHIPDLKTAAVTVCSSVLQELRS
jgi:hypothetical protein